MITLEQLRTADEDAAVAVANLRASIEGRSSLDNRPAETGLRGLVVGKLNALLGGDEARHVFVEAAVGIRGGSCKGLTHGQAVSLMHWIGEGGDALAPRIVAAAEQAAGQIELPPAMWLEEKGETEVTEEQKGAEAVTQWTGDEEKRESFWRWTHDEGLSAEQVLKALGVNDLADYKGTKVDALHACQTLFSVLEMRRVIERLATTEREHGEAAVIAFTWEPIYTPSGLEVKVTARQGATAEDVAASALALAGGLEILAEHGWKTDGRVRHIQVPELQPQPQAPIPTPVQIPTGPPPPPPAPGTAGPPAPPQQAPAGAPQGEQVLDAVRFTVGLSSSQRPQVAFYAEGHQYADLKWSFGGEKLLEASPSLGAAGWTAAHFDAIGAEHALRCRVYWAFSEKVSSTGKPYKNITRVEVA